MYSTCTFFLDLFEHTGLTAYVLAQCTWARAVCTYYSVQHVHVQLQYNLPPVLDVLVDHAGDAHGDEGKVPAGHEHDCQAEAESEHRQGPEAGKQSMNMTAR